MLTIEILKEAAAVLNDQRSIPLVEDKDIYIAKYQAYIPTWVYYLSRLGVKISKDVIIANINNKARLAGEQIIEFNNEEDKNEQS